MLKSKKALLLVSRAQVFTPECMCSARTSCYHHGQIAYFLTQKTFTYLLNFKRMRTLLGLSEFFLISVTSVKQIFVVKHMKMT